MDGAIAIILISVAMFVGCFILGMIPLLIRFSEEKLQFVTVFGAGLLCGTALAVIIPEGVELMESSWRGLKGLADVGDSIFLWHQSPLVMNLILTKAHLFKESVCSSMATIGNTSESGSNSELAAGKGLSPHFFIGVSLVIGFTLMFVVDQIGSYCSIHDPGTGLSNSISVTTTLGLVIHAAADGVALGAAVASSQVSVQVIVFFAVILHKAPAAFGLVSFLMHAGLERNQIQKHLLAFAAAAPVLAISTYFILSATGGSPQHRLSATGIGMLFSAGTFLYVATVHVLPEISSRGQHHSSHLHHHPETGAYQQGG